MTQDRSCVRAAAICYRVRAGTPEFLLVRTKGGRYWTFPKGHIDDTDLDAPAGAAREAREEAGVIGRVSNELLTTYRYPANPGDEKCPWIDVHAYLLEVLDVRTEGVEDRAQRWFAPNEAKDALGEGRDEPFPAEHARLIDAAVRSIQR